MITLYGIRNCDSCRAAQRLLSDSGCEFVFHDVRESPLSKAMIAGWLKVIDWSELINKRSATWRNLDSDARDALSVATTPATLLAHPTLMKRPLLIDGQQTALGLPAIRAHLARRKH